MILRPKSCKQEKLWRMPQGYFNTIVENKKKRFRKRYECCHASPGIDITNRLCSEGKRSTRIRNGYKLLRVASYVRYTSDNDAQNDISMTHYAY